MSWLTNEDLKKLMNDSGIPERGEWCSTSDFLAYGQRVMDATLARIVSYLNAQATRHREALRQDDATRTWAKKYTFIAKQIRSECLGDVDVGFYQNDPGSWTFCEECQEDPCVCDEALEEDEIPCGCKYCHCPNTTMSGEVCNDCLKGIHQG